MENNQNPNANVQTLNAQKVFFETMEQVKDSMQILMDKHNELSQVIENFENKLKDITQFLLFNSRKYRKFYNKNYLENKY